MYTSKGSTLTKKSDKITSSHAMRTSTRSKGEEKISSILMPICATQFLYEWSTSTYYLSPTILALVPKVKTLLHFGELSYRNDLKESIPFNMYTDKASISLCFHFPNSNTSYAFFFNLVVSL